METPRESPRALKREAAGLEPQQSVTDYFVHESSYVDDGAQVGSGTRIWHFCHVMSTARIGRGCNLGQNVFVAGDVTLGDNVKIQNNVSLYTGVTVEDDVFLGPSMVCTNVVNPRSHVSRRDEYRPTLFRRGSSVGANATIVCGVTIGQYAFIGAGAVVTRDVPDFALVHGNPARIRGWMCQCGEKLPRLTAADADEADECQVCGAAYVKRGSVVSISQEATR